MKIAVRLLSLLLLFLDLHVPIATSAVAQVQNKSGVVKDTTIRWVQTRAFPATEAFQAAAADEEFVYAISSKLIAKYSRATGERIAVSQGEAKHLNSGFFWKERLYCSHSNYPLKPEQSQVKVLDVESMRLSTFKDLDDFGGSLTWVARHNDHWWCNFAYYGTDNGRTFLVQFDNDWHERGRWTYPTQVIRELGKYSLSGGLWHDGDLLVTGHDDAVLYRLRLPEQGDVLEYGGCQRAPITGQGISHDPSTGGLIGINRSKRQVVFAAQETRPFRLRVLSYNIHHGEGIDGTLDLERIARVILSVAPDLVALQEVDRNTQRTMLVDQPAILAYLTKMHVVFGDNVAFEDGQYGNAVLSQFPIQRHENHALPRFGEGEQRGVLEVEMRLPDNQPSFLLLATHFDHGRNDRQRIKSALTINELIARRKGTAALLAGDLNDVPDSATLIEFGKKWKRANEQIAPTFPVDMPTKQIDYVMFCPVERWSVIETKVLDEAIASDHRAVLAVLELSSP